VCDDAVDEVRQYGGLTPEGDFRVFPESRRQHALDWAAS
jgi:hypothetical protein